MWFFIEQVYIGAGFPLRFFCFYSTNNSYFPSPEAGATGHRTKELKSHYYIQIKLHRNSIYSAESGDSLPEKKKAHQFWV